MRIETDHWIIVEEPRTGSLRVFPKYDKASDIAIAGEGAYRPRNVDVAIGAQVRVDGCNLNEVISVAEMPSHREVVLTPSPLRSTVGQLD